MVAGVASGLALFFDVDPVLVRLGLAALCVFGGAGLVLYAAGWILIPEAPLEEAPSPPAPLLLRRPIGALGVGLIGLGAVLLLRALIPWVAHQPVWPLAVIALGLLLLMARR
jgi:phage shock protein PspC (stress-responsive transcriptional regulator)